jgi:hypothetical protein
MGNVNIDSPPSISKMIDTTVDSTGLSMNLLSIKWFFLFVFQSCLLVLYLLKILKGHCLEKAVSGHYLRADHRPVGQTIHTGEHDLVSGLYTLIY